MFRPGITGYSLVAAVAAVVTLLAGVYLALTVYRDFRLLGSLSTTEVAAVGQSEAESALVIDSLINARLFGEESGPQTAEKRDEEAPETRLSLELKGVFSSNRAQASSALIAERGKSARYYHIGDRLPGGATLDRVASAHVELRRNGRLERLSFSPPGTDRGNERPIPINVQPSGSNFPAPAGVSGDRRVESLRERLRQLRDAQKDLAEDKE